MSLATRAEPARPRSRLSLFLVLAVCAAPVVASYLVYYFVRPDARSNYGTLIEPQRPVPSLTLKTLDGRAVADAGWRGKWSMLMVAGGACDDACRADLYHLRQVRLTTGKDRDRVQRLWLISDDAPPPTNVIREYDGTGMLRADPRELRAWLADPATPGDRYAAHIYLVDPLGNLMMRFPADADPNRTKRDLQRLLRASRVG